MNQSPVSRENKQTERNNIKILISASIVGGVLTSFLVTPLDVVKTRLQTQDKPISTGLNNQQHNKHLFKGTLDAFKKIYKNEGIFTFWRGLTPSLLMTVPNTTIYFTSYEYIKEFLYQYGDSEPYNIYAVPLIAGTAARMVSASVTSPLELLRTNSQGIDLSNYKQSTATLGTPTQHQKFNSVTLFRDIIKNVGIKGLWRGYFPTIIRDVPFSSLYWLGYEVVKSKLMKLQNPNYKIRSQQSPFLINFISGAVSGTIAAVLTTPIDVIKTKIQITVQKQQQQQQYVTENHLNGIRHQFKQIIKEEGFIGLTSGLVPRVAKVAPGLN
ncbi:hypothetical protein DICPUDRAFT_156209 [Dictyostelium purpureum]|uniref:Mitochondrial substrate carrier family protein n=1 Tax=Dictyostelium purpureum TaxID=5786 RepID=F0ZW02_DICPU|nr:uncharacterized protein DICPUDRAFT_156209 [Dictyostelium purpureum]EGC31873.1 hypothetical protein DICPUDRAFT_156209 [Dictyostelium purpureum]|eukprot:XP_003291607.1 hypothetical protein DICPUDRAFT_156209 [Dictyostelium purpureum]